MPEISATQTHRDPHWWQVLGPGFVVAATGIGAGDLIAAAVAGSRYGLAILWAVALGALFKWVLNEGVSRWQLATGSTLIEGWITQLPRPVGWYFLAYLVLWAFLVAAALGSACGIAAHALVPAVSIKVWGVVHAAAGFVVILWGRYATFERLIKGFVALMFVVVIVCAAVSGPDLGGLARGLFLPTVPEGSATFLLGVMGGVGGSVTLLCYGYWVREKGWHGGRAHRISLIDLTSAYALTGIFAVAIIVIAVRVGNTDTTGSRLVLALGEQLGAEFGPAGRYCFLLGFWAAVVTSLLGVWQGVPYLFADYLRTIRSHRAGASTEGCQPNLAQSSAYRWFLGYLAFPPLIMLHFDRPVLVVVIYAVAGAFFMPFLAGVLLVMNNRRDWVGSLRNPWLVNLLLVLSLLVFGFLFGSEVWMRLSSAV